MIKRSGKELDCEKCEGKMPDVSKVQRYLSCFQLCDSQLRATHGALYGMDWNVVLQVAASQGIKLTRLFFRLLRAFENILITEVSKRGKSGS